MSLNWHCYLTKLQGIQEGRQHLVTELGKRNHLPEIRELFHYKQ